MADFEIIGLAFQVKRLCGNVIFRYDRFKVYRVRMTDFEVREGVLWYLGMPGF